ncbi:MAG: hypothetical protein AAGJ34_00865 [Pseudomonadota bacterium]
MNSNLRIHLHVGPPTSGMAALGSLLKANAAYLEEAGVGLRINPGHAGALQSAVKSGDGPAALFERWRLPETLQTLIVFDDQALGSRRKPFGKHFWYGPARPRIEQVHKYFDGYDVRTSISTRNPAELIPAMYAQTLSEKNIIPFSEFIGTTPPHKLLWGDLIERMQLRDAYLPVLVWTYEDFPRIWRDVLGAITGVDNPQMLEGPVPVTPQDMLLEHSEDFAVRHAQAPDEAKPSWDAYLEDLPDPSNLTPHPVWTPALHEELTDIYDEDLYTIARMEAVYLVRPRPLF